MNSKKNLVAILLTAMMILPFLTYAQNMATKEKAGLVSGVIWQPVKLTADGNNVLNGVTIYKKKSQCSVEDGVLLRFVNSNKYAVKVEWQTSAQSPKMLVVVSGNTDMLGSCPSPKDISSINMFIATPKTEIEKQKTKEYFVAHLTVTEVKN